ncbi:MAG: hypothetical protein IPK79_08895 [Vampirovibrionales bacterium]|nr:hypothetical protein [Vampirovibrionales bacterium]
MTCRFSAGRAAFTFTALLSAVLLIGGVTGMLAPAASTTPSAPKRPVQLEVEPQKQIFSRREGLMMRVTLKALQPVPLCLEKDPLTQFRFRIFRSGFGELPLAPLVSRDTRVIFGQRPQARPLEAGRSWVYRLNLKRLQFLDGESWASGDYAVNASFLLCDPDGGDAEITAPARRPARFMIMN